MNKRKEVIWLFQTGEPLAADNGSYRAMRLQNLADKFSESKIEVRVITSKFFHQAKRFRTSRNFRREASPLIKYSLILSSGYRRNKSFARLLDHTLLAFSLSLWLLFHINERPKFIFIGFPPVEAAFILVLWGKMRALPTFLDVKDQWPSYITEQFSGSKKVIAEIVLGHLFYMARFSMKNATSVTSMSQSYIDWIYSFSGRTSNECMVVPLASRVNVLPESAALRDVGCWEKNSICFVGTLSSAFDFSVFKSIAKWLSRCDSSLCAKLLVCGEGPESDALKELYIDHPNVEFKGWVSGQELQQVYGQCFCSLSPYRNSPNFNDNVPNKVIDSLHFGVPVVTLLHGEVGMFINEEKCGAVIDNDETSIFEALDYVYENHHNGLNMSFRARQVAKLRFDPDAIYKAFCNYMIETSSKCSR